LKEQRSAQAQREVHHIETQLEQDIQGMSHHQHVPLEVFNGPSNDEGIIQSTEEADVHNIEV